MQQYDRRVLLTIASFCDGKRQVQSSDSQSQGCSQTKGDSKPVHAHTHHQRLALKYLAAQLCHTHAVLQICCLQQPGMW